MTITIAQNSAQPLIVNRLGYGTMRLTGPEIWGEPANRSEAVTILRTAVELGVNFLDTADYYGQDVTNRLIAEALHPYASDLVICTKVGATRQPDKSWVPHNTPENSAPAQRHGSPDKHRLAAAQIALAAADSGHLVAGASAGKPGGGRHSAERGGYGVLGVSVSVANRKPTRSGYWRKKPPSAVRK